MLYCTILGLLEGCFHDLNSRYTSYSLRVKFLISRYTVSFRESTMNFMYVQETLQKQIA